jgi:hypothetical protein
VVDESPIEALDAFHKYLPNKSKNHDYQKKVGDSDEPLHQPILQHALCSAVEVPTGTMRALVSFPMWTCWLLMYPTKK